MLTVVFYDPLGLFTLHLVMVFKSKRALHQKDEAARSNNVHRQHDKALPEEAIHLAFTIIVLNAMRTHRARSGIECRI